MKRAFTALVLLLCVSGVPVSSTADGPYTLATGAQLSATGTAFEKSGCNPSILTSPANGSDARIVSINHYATNPPSKILVKWTASAVAPAAGAGLLARFYNSACTQVPQPSGNKGSGPVQGNWTLTVPTGSKWLFVEGLAVVNVSFTFSKI